MRPRVPPSRANSPWSWDAIDQRVRERYADGVLNITSRLDRGVLGKLDQIGLGPSLARLGAACALHPLQSAAVMRQWTQGAFLAGWSATTRAFGADSPPQVPTGRDKRFADPAWADNAAFWLLRQQYLLAEEQAADLVEGAGRSERTGSRSRFLAQACSTRCRRPTSPAPTPRCCAAPSRPAGSRWRRAARNFLRDLANNGGQPQQVAKGVYEVGREHGRHPGQGRVPQRPDGADPVLADHRDGARDPAAVQPAVDQQVLRHGPRARTAAWCSGRSTTATPCS